MPLLLDTNMIQTSAARVEPIVTSHGILRTRPEADADADFLFALYESVKGPEMAAVAVDDRMKHQLLRMQFKAMTLGYRTAFPAARYDLILLNEEPIGRLILDIEPSRTHIVYIALLPQWRNRRIAEALMTSVLAEPRRLGSLCEATVARDNTASLRLWNKLGFEERERVSMDVIMEWRTA
jgi:ribosomal protein S18 acetylase RimI-like enzyme